MVLCMAVGAEGDEIFGTIVRARVVNVVNVEMGKGLVLAPFAGQRAEPADRCSKALNNVVLLPGGASIDYRGALPAAEASLLASELGSSCNHNSTQKAGEAGNAGARAVVLTGAEQVRPKRRTACSASSFDVGRLESAPLGTEHLANAATPVVALKRLLADQAEVHASEVWRF